MRFFQAVGTNVCWHGGWCYLPEKTSSYCNLMIQCGSKRVMLTGLKSEKMHVIQGNCTCQKSMVFEKKIEWSFPKGASGVQNKFQQMLILVFENNCVGQERISFQVTLSNDLLFLRDHNIFKHFFSLSISQAIPWQAHHFYFWKCKKNCFYHRQTYQLA